MELDALIFIFFIFSIAVYLLMQPHLTYLIIGFALLSNGINLMILYTSGAPDIKAAPITTSASFGAEYVDPLPQALILTAIVIGFGLISFTVVLAFRLLGYYKTLETHTYIDLELEE